MDKNKLECLFENNKLVSKRITENWLNRNGLLNEIIQTTSFLNNTCSLNDRVWAILLDLKAQPLCKECNELVFYRREIKNFAQYCSNMCAGRNKDKLKNVDIDYKKANERRVKTNLKKYGVAYNSQRKEVKCILSDKMKYQMDEDKRQILNDYDWMNNEYNVKGRTATSIADELGVYYGTVLDYCEKHNFKIRSNSNTSKYEYEIENFLQSLNIVFEKGNRTVIKPLELDFYLPNNNLAIEFNGLYWHSSKLNDNVNYHINKTKKCEENNLQLLHIFEDEWINKKDIWQSIIKAKLNLFDKNIYARKCIIKQIDNKIAKCFLEKTHLQGYVHGKHYGLFYKDVMVALATVGKSRFKENEYELLRWSVDLNTRVIGGFTKVLSFINLKMITFADRRISKGKTYQKFGKFLYDTSPSYWWVDLKSMKRISRFKTQKHKLNKLLGEKYDSTKSEKENMFNNGYRIIYDCGTKKYLLLNNGTTKEKIKKLIKQNLTPDLLKKGFNEKAHCYVASEAFYYLMGGKLQGYGIYRMKIDGVTHWWIKKDKEIIDLTSDQFNFKIDYSKGRHSAFLTNKPSKRAQILINRILENNNVNNTY